jgi:TRAP-type C4-dicarboxylate transport system permease small subunit
MNANQKKIVFLEMILIGLVLFGYFTKTLTFNLLVTILIFYSICVIAWFYYKSNQDIARIPAVDNPLVFGEWPYYIIYLIFIGIILMLIAKLPFDIKTLIDKRKF